VRQIAAQEQIELLNLSPPRALKQPDEGRRRPEFDAEWQPTVWAGQQPHPDHAAPGDQPVVESQFPLLDTVFHGVTSPQSVAFSAISSQF
jgi:hypothetical protein